MEMRKSVRTILKVTFHGEILKESALGKILKMHLDAPGCIDMHLEASGYIWRKILGKSFRCTWLHPDTFGDIKDILKEIPSRNP